MCQMPSIRKICLLSLCLLITFFSTQFTPAFSQTGPIEITSSLNPVGSGARALGMGGAFMAVADDATAASWNPGGLIQLDLPEVSIVGAGFYRSEDNTFGTNPEASGSQSIAEGRVNYLSASWPFKVMNYNMIVSANYQHLYDFTRGWDFILTEQDADLSLSQDVDYDQDGSLSAFGLAYCVEIVPTLSFGVTLNFWEDGIYDNEWKQRVNQKGSGTHEGDPFSFSSNSYEKYSFSGFNVNLGVLWNATENLTIGAVLKTPFEADLRHESRFTSSMVYPLDPSRNTAASLSSVAHEDLDMPLSYGIGFAYRFSDSFTASMDVYRTQWDDFILTDSKGEERSFVTGKPESESDVDATYQVRVGAEYLIFRPNYIIPLRAGVFYDPAPAEGSPDDYYGISVGAGIARGVLVFDVAYQYRFGNSVGAHVLEGYGFSQDVDEHTVYSSLIIHF